MLIAVIRTIVVYIIILIAFRIMGKRQISQMQTSELVATIILSELAVMPIQNIKEPFLNGLIPMLIIVLLEVIMAYAMIKSNSFRKLTCGKPIVLIEKGKINQKNLKTVKISVEDLYEQLRQKEAFFLEEVDYAIIETSGTLSVIKKAEDNPVTAKDMLIKTKNRGIEVVVVSDGVLSKASVELSGHTPEWIEERIRNSGFTIKEVFIMTLDSTGNYKIIPREI